MRIAALGICCSSVIALIVSGTAIADINRFESVDVDTEEWLEIDTRDRSGLRRDTWYFMSYQWVTIGMLYVAPESVSGWTDEQKEDYNLSVWWDNVTRPQMDSDDFYINYVLHPYWGAAYYVRARERGYSDREGFWYAVLLSSVYEFGAEALFEEPSIQDLVVTPVVGTWLGRYFTRVRGDIMEREAQGQTLTSRDKWVRGLTDPLGYLNGRVDRLLGRETYLRIRPYRRRHSIGVADASARPVQQDDIVYGIEVRLRW